MKLSVAINKPFSQIKNIIFDWGGVITNISLQKSAEAFENIGFNEFGKQYGLSEQADFYRQFEEGKLTATEFRNRIRSFITHEVTDHEIDDAWTAMLLDTPAEHLKLLENLKIGYRTFLLSNTSSIHVDFCYKNFLKQYGKEGFNRLFEKVYFSYRVGIRKPDQGIFELVINENILIPEETLYIDDVFANVEAAAKTGMIAYHLQPPKTLTSIFEPEVKTNVNVSPR
ncbi:MAG: HAD family phosphatase [Bacteroidales bacterium]|nr:HAD family phosphatase [Bacteroidales bacterium]